MSTREDRAVDDAREQKRLHDNLVADLSHAKDKAEENRLQKKYDEDVAAAKDKRDEDDRVEAERDARTTRGRVLPRG